MFHNFVCLFLLVCLTKIEGIFSNYFFGYFLQLYLFLLSYGTLYTWSFLVYFLYSDSLISMLYLLIHQILSSLHSALLNTSSEVFSSAVALLFSSKTLICFSFPLYLLFYCCWAFFFWLTLFYFTFVYEPVYNCLLKHFHDACFKIFQIILTSVSSVLVLVSCLSLSIWGSSWFLVQ